MGHLTFIKFNSLGLLFNNAKFNAEPIASPLTYHTLYYKICVSLRAV